VVCSRPYLEILQTDLAVSSVSDGGEDSKSGDLSFLSLCAAREANFLNPRREVESSLATVAGFDAVASRVAKRAKAAFGIIEEVVHI